MLQKSILAIAFVFMSFSIIHAQLPQLINYQALLTDATGKAITGDRTIQFKIYSEATGGTEVWTETQSVTVTNGLFNVLLGSKTPISYSVFDGSDKYLALKIGTDSEMAPRKRLVSVGYAFRAHDANNVSGTGNIFPSNGNVGIGTTTPGYKLEVMDVIAITGNGNEGGQLSLIDGDSKGGWEIDNFGSSGDEALRVFRDRGFNDVGVLVIKNSGNIGIGEDFPTAKLQVNGMVHSMIGGFKFPDGSIQTKAVTSGGTADNLGNHIATQNIELNGHWLSNDGDNEGIFIRDDGHVGVGTTVPFERLTVNGGVVSKMGGFVFPDGTVQTTAATGSGLALPYSKTVASSDPAFSVTNTGEGHSVFGTSQYIGKSGIYGKGCIGVRGECTYWGVGSGVRGEADDAFTYGIHGINSKGYAGYFSGAVRVTGLLEKPGGGFMIDHPLDPAHKYLYHSFVESPDMKNIYDGVVILDSLGEGSVQLPNWFEALNKDFRYQLTCIGGYAPVYISEEITNNRFKIAGGKPRIKVSWQITGIRQDVWANVHRIPVEEEKEGNEIGKYLHPRENGVSETLGIDYEEVKKKAEDYKRMDNTQKRIEEQSYKMREEMKNK